MFSLAILGLMTTARGKVPSGTGPCTDTQSSEAEKAPSPRVSGTSRSVLAPWKEPMASYVNSPPDSPMFGESAGGSAPDDDLMFHFEEKHEMRRSAAPADISSASKQTAPESCVHGGMAFRAFLGEQQGAAAPSTGTSLGYRGSSNPRHSFRIPRRSHESHTAMRRHPSLDLARIEEAEQERDHAWFHVG